jgi:2-C-methyl-D-erythritol 4-phosphate cytidylyltransferase
MLGDAPVLVHAARAVLAGGYVRYLVVAAPAGELEAVAAMLEVYGLNGEALVTVVEGGATRQASVARGLAAVPGECELVLVHDAARPFLPADRLEAVLRAAHDAGAAALALPVADTLRRAAGDELGETVSREGLWAMQTPQAAHAAALREVVDAAQRDGYEGTDEVELLERAGTRVRVVEGDARNLKLTTPGDWAIAEALVTMQGMGDG